MSDEKPEEIRQQIEQTSQELKSKVEMLEEQVIGTVQGTTEAVGDTVEKVKETVDTTVEKVKETVAETIESVRETVASVKRTFDLKYQTRQHPWPMVGASLVAGFAAGKFLGRFQESRRSPQSSSNGERSAANGSRFSAAAPTAGSTPPANGSESPSFFSRLLGQFEGEIQKIKQTAIGTVFSVVRDLAKQALPSGLGDKVDEVIDSVTTKLGGEVLSSSVLQSGTGT